MKNMSESSNILAHLNTQGWIRMSNSSLPAFLKSANNLGNPFFETDVVLISGRQESVHRPDAFNPHNDSPEADYIGWYIVNSDSCSTPMLFYDSRIALSELSSSDLNVLNTIPVRYPSLRTGTIVSQSGWLVEYSFDGAAVLSYSQDNVDVSSLSSQQIISLRKLIIELNNIEPFEINISDRDCVFINNKIMLHGRVAMKKNSSRHLYRLWINSSGLFKSKVNLNGPKEH